MTDDLKPCPFCGETATATGEYMVECDGCCVIVPVSGRFWNHRPAEEALAAERDALRAEVERLRGHVSALLVLHIAHHNHPTHGAARAALNQSPAEVNQDAEKRQ